MKCMSLHINVSTEEILPDWILKFGRHFELEEKIQFLHARFWPFKRVRVTRVWPNFFATNRIFVTTHGDKPINQNGIPLRSLSPILAPINMK